MGTAKRACFIIYRLLVAGLVAAAIITQLAHGLKGPHFSVVNFFSFFTIQSNLFGLLVFAISAVLLMCRRTWRVLPFLRGAATTYMIMTGIIFALLLSGKTDVQTTLPWVNTVVHQLFPIIIAVDWLIDSPGRIPYHKALWWLIYPLAYLAYSLVRGSIVHWYPYPFLNPATGGYDKLVLTSVIILVATFGLLGLLVLRTRFGSMPQRARK